jgi:uncharacterized protein YjbI with pentapeptide repeats
VKIIKPLKLGLLHRTYKFKQQTWFVASPIVFFRLGTNEILAEHSQWPIALSGPGVARGLDMGMPKVHGEVLISGFAFAGGNKYVKEQKAGFTIGSLTKDIRVLGDRKWCKCGSNYKSTDPEPFNKMPITYDLAFGGEEFSENTSGCGYESVKNNNFVIPNIESTNSPVTDIGAVYETEGFLPLDLTVPSQQKKAGTYNDYWLKNEYPGYPSDIDWTIFNVARKDQRINEFFNGNECYEIRNMHPEKQIIGGTLPNVNVRVFIQKADVSGSVFSEIVTVLDTVWFFPDNELGVLIFRGKEKVLDSNGLDIDTCMCAYENTGDVKRSADYYKKILELRLNPKTAIQHVFNDSQLSPVLSIDTINKINIEKQLADKKILADKQASIDRVIDQIFDGEKVKMPENFNRPVATAGILPVITHNAIQSADFDLSEIFGKIDSLVETTKKESELKMKDAKEKTDAMLTENGKEQDDFSLKTKHIEFLEKLLNTGSSDECIDKTMESLIEPSKLENVKNAFVSAGEVKNKARQFSDIPVIGKISSSDSEYSGKLIKKIIASGKSIQGLDCNGAQMSGTDFSGYDLRNTMFEYADLRGCNFTGSNCSGMVLTSALLDGADFSNAVMNNANLCSVNTSHSKFTNCSMKNAIMNNSKFTECVFDRVCFTGVQAMKTIFDLVSFRNVDCDNCLFINSSLKDSVWSGSGINKTLFIGANLTNANFKQTSIRKSVMINAIVDYADFTEASLFQVQTSETASFRNVKFINCKIEECGFRGVDLSEMNAVESKFIRSDLSNANLLGADLTNASLLRSMLFCTKMIQTKLVNADLFESIAKKADFTDADISGTSFHTVETLEAVFNNTVDSETEVVNS